MFRIEVDVNTGKSKQVSLTPEEVAEAQEKTKLEKDVAENKKDKTQELLDDIDKAKDLDDIKALMKKLV